MAYNITQVGETRLPVRLSPNEAVDRAIGAARQMRQSGVNDADVVLRDEDDREVARVCWGNGGLVFLGLAEGLADGSITVLGRRVLKQHSWIALGI